jgi:hypothetical protein
MTSDVSALARKISRGPQVRSAVRCKPLQSAVVRIPYARTYASVSVAGLTLLPSREPA